MEARLVDDLPVEPGWQFEPKWDGFRCLAFRAGDRVELRAKSGKPLARYFPEVEALLRRLEPSRFVLDGELAIPLGETLSFDALQMRLHPAASRIRKLARETPAVFIVFDLLATPTGESLVPIQLAQRRTALEAFYHSVRAHEALKLSPFTRDLEQARRWLGSEGAVLDGVSPSVSMASMRRANERCSRSRSSAQQIASSAGFDTNATVLWWDPFCLVSTTVMGISITSVLPPHSMITTARR
jgi:ATP-dependent DNA ligase